MKSAILTAMLACAPLMLKAAGPASGEVLPGCYARDYSAAHLARNPGQHVAALRLSFYLDPGTGQMLVDVLGRFADQGRARDEGIGIDYFSQSAACARFADGLIHCSVDCDGGEFIIGPPGGQQGGQPAQRLTISTRHFSLESPEGCEARTNLAETGPGLTTYLLDRASPETCLGVE